MSDYVDRIHLTNANLRDLANGDEAQVAGESGAWTTVDGSELSDADIRRLVTGEAVEGRTDDGLFLLDTEEAR